MSSPLREFLATQPLEHNYDLKRIRNMRNELRRKLFAFATADGQFIDYLFGPGVDMMSKKPTEWLGSSDKGVSHSGRPCVRKLSTGEPTYRCVTCGLDDTCVLCQYCFNPREHEGHDVILRITICDDGGICVCGDPEAWKVPLTCMADEKPHSFEPIPANFRTALVETISTALDFCIDVLASAHPGVQFMDRADQVRNNTAESQLDPRIYGQDIPGDSQYVLCLWNDERRSILDFTQAIENATKRNAQFSKMVARKIHEYGRGIAVASSNIDNLLLIKQQASLFTATIRSTRDHMREEMVDEIMHWLLDMSQARLRNAPPGLLAEIIGEALCDPWNCGNLQAANNKSMGTLLPFPYETWLNSMLDGKNIPLFSKRLNNPDFCTPVPKAAPTNPEEIDFSPSHLTFNALSPRNFWENEVNLFKEAEAEKVEIQNSVGTPRVKFLIFFDIRLWKSLRTTLGDIYVNTLISSHALKPRLGSIYADVYPQILELFIILDREPEVSIICSLSTQLFTTPSIASKLARGYCFPSFLSSLYTLYTLQKMGPPQCINKDLYLDVDSPILRNRRCSQLFHEFEYLLSRNPHKSTVVSNPDRLLELADFFSLFQGLSPMKRQTDKHIEFENENWVFFFTTIPFILQLAQVIANCTYECDFNDVKEAISQVATLLLRWSFAYSKRVTNAERLETYTLKAHYGDRYTSATLPDPDIDKGVISLHHPVHAFLSWLLQNCHVPNAKALQDMLFAAVDAGIFPEYDRTFVKLMLFDHCIQTLGVLSQMHVGLWVRNGYTVRSQLHHYRENTLRGLSYARDLYIAQIELVSVGPNEAFLHLLSRYNLSENSSLFDESQRYYMLEEFLHALKSLLVDRIYLQDAPSEKINEQYFRREIVQALTFMDMSYSELWRNIPETMTLDDAFEPVLKQCTKFTPPKGVRDVGMYSLNPDLIEEFDPHYTHFSSAKIEEAEKVIAKHLSKKFGCPAEDIVHLAPLRKLNGPWADLGAFTRSVAFARFIFGLFYDLLRGCNPSNQAHVETVLGRAFYLLLMSAKDDLTRDPEQSVNDPGVYSSMAEWVSTREHDGTTLTFASLLTQILNTAQFSALHPRCRKLFNMLSIKQPEMLSNFSLSFKRPDHVERESDKRKKVGKEAQRRIMEDMRRQQSEFERRLGSEDEEEDDMEIDSSEENESVRSWSFDRSNCVLCHTSDTDQTIFGQMTFTSQTSVIRQMPYNIPKDWISEGYGANSPSLDAEAPSKSSEIEGSESWKQYWSAIEDSREKRAYPQELVDKSASIVTGCGHGVHWNCYHDYIVMQRTRQSQNQSRQNPDYAQRGEYLCPLCRALNNSFVPILWGTNKLSASDVLGPYADNQMGTLVQLLSGSVEPSASYTRSKLVSETVLPKFAENLSDPADSFRVLLHQAACVRSTNNSDHHGLDLSLVMNSYSNSIKLMEIALRGVPHSSAMGGIVVDQLSSKNLKNVRLFSHYMETLASYALVRKIPYKKLDPRNIDPFKMFVYCLFLVKLNYGITPQTALRLAIAGCIMQQVRTLQSWERLGDIPTGTSLNDEIALEVLAEALPQHRNQIQLVYGMIERNVTILLRRVAIAVFGLAGSYEEDEFKFMMARSEQERLALYLGVPTLAEILRTWRTASVGQQQLSLFIEHTSFSILEYPGVYRLIRLPHRLDTFFSSRSRTDGSSTDQAVCLFCGEIIPLDSPLLESGQKGPCTLHVDRCARHYGMFLFPIRNHMFLTINGGRGTFSEAPYLDLHGEHDENMRRGKPHFLHKVRYDSLTRGMWLENEIFNFIVRKIDQTVDFGGWETI